MNLALTIYPRAPRKLQPPKPRPSKLTCVECRAEFPGGELKDHLVSAHGYIREGAMVFKRQFCHVCEASGKKSIAIYKEVVLKKGIFFFCSKHKSFAHMLSQSRVATEDRRHGAISAYLDERDEVGRLQDALHRGNRTKSRRAAAKR